MLFKAISPEYSAFVSASAGTGKTKILIDRLVNLLLNGIKPSKILCLAFTKAAANEIQIRINQKLSEFSTCNENLLKKELDNLGFNEISHDLIYKARILFTELLEESEALNIQTIHSFCQQLIQNFPIEAGVNLNFNLLNENQMMKILEEANDTLLNNIQLYPKAEQAISYLSWHLKEYSLKELLQEIMANREALDIFFNTHQNLDNAINSISHKIIDEDIIIREFISNIPIRLENIEPLYNGGKNDITRAEKLKEFLSSPIKAKIININNYLSCFLTSTGQATKNILSKKIADNYIELLKIFEEEQQRSLKFDHFLKNIKAVHLTKAFITLSYYIRQIYSELKQNYNYLDYDDLISISLKLLNSSIYSDWINYKLNNGIDHILVDEAQDNSSAQWQIIYKISEDFFYNTNKSIFIVGDAKQSIFSFQGAEPKLFNEMNHSLPESVLRLQLNKSYRSGAKILELVDRIFNQSHIISQVTNIEKVIEHKLHKSSGSSVELWPLVIEENKVDKQEWILPSNFIEHNKNNISYQTLAEIIAKRIKEDLTSGVIKTPGDILILTRRRTDFINILIETLRKYNIPTSGIDRLNLLEHPIILDLIALTNFLLCSSDDLNLAIVLKSPIFNLSEDELLKLCCNREQTLWDKLKQSSSKVTDMLEHLLISVKEKSPFQFYFYIIESLSFREIFNRYYPAETNDILDSFLDLISEYEKNNILSLQLCIEFLSSNKTEIKRVFLHNNSQVRIMTIHNAKGLQAKTVFLTDTTTLPSNKDTITWLNQDKLLWTYRDKYSPDIAKEMKNTKQTKEYAEYLRLLYVALTRAEDRLIICGTAKEENIPEGCWYSIIKNAL